MLNEVKYKKFHFEKDLISYILEKDNFEAGDIFLH